MLMYIVWFIGFPGPPGAIPPAGFPPGSMPPGMPPPNFAMPPPGFMPPSGGQVPANAGASNMDGAQELWVETKTAEGKVCTNMIHMVTSI